MKKRLSPLWLVPLILLLLLIPFVVPSALPYAGAEGKAVSLVAETKEGRHSFRVVIAPPEGQSFAKDIAEKYGVTYESLTALSVPEA